MDYSIARNIQRLRWENNLTQKAVAEYLGVSFQTVSKWEKGTYYPDITLLPALADLFGVSVDTLLGHTPGTMKRTMFSELYKNDEYFWGTKPTEFCYHILERYPPIRYMRLLEIGCGEGSDAVFFARNGYDVTAYDIAQEGVRKTKLLAARQGVPVTTFCEDMLTFQPKEMYDVIYASRSLQYLPPHKRKAFFETYKKYTKPGGLHAFMVFVDKPVIPDAPDAESNIFRMKSGEIFTYYYDWPFLVFEEKIIDCNSSGIPHKHCVNLMMAVKPE